MMTTTFSVRWNATWRSWRHGANHHKHGKLVADANQLERPLPPLATWPVSLLAWKSKRSSRGNKRASQQPQLLLLSGLALEE
mmetsp:Transcript_11328/g.22733  ORF Transcript_11328/g.22733 Transcript_11328/m.22733 type:complete len:82 (+) Transcript_11328:269-514(+)